MTCDHCTPRPTTIACHASELCDWAGSPIATRSPHCACADAVSALWTQEDIAVFNRIKTFALNAGHARRSSRANFPAEFARPTIEERIVRALRRKS